MMADGAVSWITVKQTFVASSIMKVEFVSYFDLNSLSIWLKSFISRFKIKSCICMHLKIFYDNSIVLFIAKNNKSQSKHVNIKYLSINRKRQR